MEPSGLSLLEGFLRVVDDFLGFSRELACSLFKEAAGTSTGVGCVEASLAAHSTAAPPVAGSTPAIYSYFNLLLFGPSVFHDFHAASVFMEIEPVA